MNYSSGKVNVHGPGNWPSIILIISTFICLVVSVYFLRMHTSIVFQNLYYFPILFACVFFRKKGLIFSIILSLIYFGLVFLYSREPDVLLQASIRVCIFILIAWVTSFLAQKNQEIRENLKEEKELFNGVFDTMPSGSAIYRVSNSGESDSDYCVGDINRTALQYENKEKSEVIGKSLAQTGPVVYDEDVIPRLAKVRKTNDIVFYQSTVQSGADSLKYFETSLFKLPSGEIVSIFTDVTSRKRIEEELRASEEKFRLAMDATSDGLWDWNLQTGEVYYSPAFEVLLEVDHMDPTFESWESRIHPHDRTKVLAALKSHKDGHTERWRAEMRIHTPGGSWKWVLNRGSVVARDDEGRPLRMIGSIADISEQKRIEEIIRIERDRAEQYLNIAEVIIVALSRDGTVVLINRKGAEVLGTPVDEIIGLNWFDTFIPPDNRAGVYSTFNALMEGTGELYSSFENEIITRQGKRILVSWVNTIIQTPSGQNIGTLSSGEDMTLRNELEQEKTRLLDQIQQNLAQMAYLNDNIRNPLALILALSSVSHEEERTRKIQEQVDIIDENVTQLDKRWVESEKVLEFIRKHYQITPNPQGDSYE